MIFYRSTTKINWFLSYRSIFQGLKDKFRYRSFMFLFCMRRSLLILILILMQSIKVSFKLIVFSMVQLPYFAIIIWLRPYESKKENFIEIINEILFWILYLSHFYLQDKADWTGTIEVVYIYLILVNNVFCSLLSFSKYSDLLWVESKI